MIIVNEFFKYKIQLYLFIRIFLFFSSFFLKILFKREKIYTKNIKKQGKLLENGASKTDYTESLKVLVE